ncbi:MAG TPA: NAD(P)H-hydrate epimerase, partial [Hyphomicrobium sp.]|nr:NAD(P)H-hydrate epimerase [Hyphomicrobium sp.]
MENAGRGVAREAEALLSGGRRVAVLCGPGNNGGDGFVAARHLRDAGLEVHVSLLGPVSALKGDAAAMAERWGLEIAPLKPAAIEGADAVVDALFGAGLARPIEGIAAEVITVLNASGLPVLAVDVPSGLDGSTGQPLGPVVKATRTITFFRRKPGHLLMPGRGLCGPVIVDDIGIPDAVLDEIDIATWANSPALWAPDFPWPRLEGHKYG